MTTKVKLIVAVSTVAVVAVGSYVYTKLSKKNDENQTSADTKSDKKD